MQLHDNMSTCQVLPDPGRHAAQQTAVGEAAPRPIGGARRNRKKEDLMDAQAERKVPEPDRRLEWAKVLATLTDALSRFLELLRR